MLIFISIYNVNSSFSKHIKKKIARKCEGDFLLRLNLYFLKLEKKKKKKKYDTLYF